MKWNAVEPARRSSRQLNSGRWKRSMSGTKHKLTGFPLLTISDGPPLPLERGNIFFLTGLMKMATMSRTFKFRSNVAGTTDCLKRNAQICRAGGESDIGLEESVGDRLPDPVINFQGRF